MKPIVRGLAVLALNGCANPPPAEAPNPHHHHHGTAGHSFKDAEAWSREFDDPARDAWQRPDDVVAAMVIGPGMTVADVGAGTGYFEGRLSSAVGPSGKVFGLDVEPDMVAFMQRRFADTPNVEARACPFDTTGLDAASVDRVLVVDTWHHIEGREAYARHLASVLRPGGSVTIVDFTLASSKGPPPEARVTEEIVMRELSAGGLSAHVVEESLPDQFIVIGEKKAADASR